MGRITSSVGLVTGVPIEETVNQLIAISARPRDLLVQRTERLQAEQLGIAELTASVIGVQLSIQQLRSSSLFDQKNVLVSENAALSATATGDPAVGTYQFTPLRQAQAHQLLSRGLASRDSPLGTGDLSIRFGGFVNDSVRLDELNGGAGVESGQIRITDRAGNSETIDLRFAQTIDDVLLAINSANDIDVTASASGDQLQLTDNTSAGQVSANLKVQEVGISRTAADLGLAGIDTSASVANGQDVLRLHDSLQLSRLKDGNGVNLKEGVADLQVSLQDGTSLEIDFLAQSKGATQSTATTSATNGVDAEVLFTSVDTGESVDGYDITFVDDDEITAGSETVEIDTLAKTLTFNIDAGSTRAVHVIAALNNDSTASQIFTAATSASGDGTGVVDVTDSATTSGGAITFSDESTIGELLQTINAVDPAKLEARISAAGDSLELVDLTSGSGTFAVTSPLGGSVAEDLGLTTSATGGVITGRRRLAGLKTVLLDSLAGGYGVGQLGTLDLTDRSGATASVDLSSAETLDDVLQAINGAAVEIEARVNEAQNGLLLEDTSGGSGNLIVASSDATADNLRIATDAATTAANSGSLDLQTVHASQLLADFNRGRGVDDGSFTITDSTGQVAAVNLAVSGAETVGDVLDAINALSIEVNARINDTGDGIVLVDTAGGAEDIEVSDVGSGTAAADLLISGTSVEVDISGTLTKVVDGATTLKVSLDASDTLDDLVQKINDAAGDVSASVFDSGSGTTPFRLALAGQITGERGRLLVDAASLGISFDDVVAAQDALLAVGAAGSNGAGALASSSTNTFDTLIDGVSLTLDGTSTEPVSVAVEQTTDSVISQLNLFVGQYNDLQDKIDDLSFFNETDETTGVLFGSSSLLRIESDLASALTGRHIGAGPIQTLEQLGLSLNDQGRLQFDASRFQREYAADSNAVEQFLTREELGAAHKLFDTLERLAGAESSVLVNRNVALQASIDNNAQRVTDLGVALEAERNRLLLQFFRMESTISQLQSNITAISQIQALAPLSVT